MKLAAALDIPRQKPEWLRLKLPSFVALLVLWQGAAVLIADSTLFPTPWATLETAYLHLMTGELLFSLAVTLARVAVAFLFAMVLGSAIGIALGRSQPADAIFGGWLSIALNMPALVTIVLCYVWFGLTETAAILAVTINKAPGRSTASSWRPRRCSASRAGRCCATWCCRNWHRASSPRPGPAWR